MRKSTYRRAAFAIVWTILGLASQAQAQSKTKSDVRDPAEMFSTDAVREAKARLEKFERTYQVPTVIETVATLRNEPIAELNVQHARKAGWEGVFILLAQKESKIDVKSSPRFQTIVGASEAKRIIDAFVGEFQKKQFDTGLGRGVDAIDAMLQKAKEEGKLASHLVARNQTRLNLAGAQRALEAAQAKAVELNLKVNIAVVDDGGHLLAFERMDGARPASVATALTKATTAATFRQATGPLPTGAATPDVLLNISLQNASGGKITTLPGGVPIVVDDQVIGAIGVGGGTGEQDATVAHAGVAGLLADLGIAAPEKK